MNKNSLRRISFLLLICAFLCVFTSCFKNDNRTAAIQKCWAFIPGTCHKEDIVSELEVLECDIYGRMLIKCNTYFFPTNQVEQLYVIGQKYDDCGIYIYEDVNYIILSYDNDIDNLKLLNDWDKPLDDSKMSYKMATVEKYWQIIKTQPTNVISEYVTNAFVEEMGISNDSIAEMLEVDIDANGKRLNMYAIGSTSRDVYAVICDDNCNIWYSKIEVDENYQESISNLKNNANWY